ncbi:MAG: hydrogenase expression/formation protein HypE [Nanoarchaeota archaeon]|nr:hydrogenase expression/formation protein HypE [Nanoarchaeota archaeon]
MPISLNHGAGGEEMNALIKSFREILKIKNDWKNMDNDSATLKIGERELCFTTDSYVVTPLFFPGGDIGKLAICGTINDLCVMGATPLGISLSLVIEEGMTHTDLKKIMSSINTVSVQTEVPVVTGDTKVMEKGKLDKMIINTAGIGFAPILFDKPLESGDVILVSGTIGDHTAALLSKRFNFKTSVISDCGPVLIETNSLRKEIKQAKDITRGGLAANLNELAQKNDVIIQIKEDELPIQEEVRSAADLLGLSIYELACEGRFMCAVSRKNSKLALEKLKKYNVHAKIIGSVRKKNDEPMVVVKTKFGERILPMPTGRLIPRIC